MLLAAQVLPLPELWASEELHLPLAQELPLVQELPLAPELHLPLAPELHLPLDPHLPLAQELHRPLAQEPCPSGDKASSRRSAAATWGRSVVAPAEYHTGPVSIPRRPSVGPGP